MAQLGRFETLLQEMIGYKWKGCYWQQYLNLANADVEVKSKVTISKESRITITKGHITPNIQALTTKRDTTLLLLPTAVLKNQWLALVAGYFLTAANKFPVISGFGDGTVRNSTPSSQDVLAYIARIKDDVPTTFGALQTFFLADTHSIVTVQEVSAAGELGLVGYGKVYYASRENSSERGRKSALAQVAKMTADPKKYQIKDTPFTPSVLGYINTLIENRFIQNVPAGKRVAPYDKETSAQIAALVNTNINPKVKTPAYVVGYFNASASAGNTEGTLIRNIQAELDHSTVEGLAQSIATVDKYLKDPQISSAVKLQLTSIRAKLVAEETAKKDSAANSKVKPKAAQGANGAAQSQAPKNVKQAMEQYNQDQNVTAADTTPSTTASYSPEQKLNASLQVLAPTEEELVASPATLDLVLSDPLGSKLSEPFYRTQLFNTDLNDFRRVQLALPNGLNQDPGASNPISFFKLQNSPTASRAASAEDEGQLPSYDNPIPGDFQYNQFFLKGVDETRNEKFQLVDTPAQGQTLFGFGEKPEFWTIRGQVINDALNDWATKLRLAWDKKLRVSQLIENGQFLEITIPALRIVLGCYPVALTISHSDDAETLPSFAMVVFKRHESVVPEVRYRRDSAVIAMVNSILSLDKKNLLLATEANALRPTFTGTDDQSTTPTAGAEPLPVTGG